jgi:hypothetical protein
MIKNKNVCSMGECRFLKIIPCLELAAGKTVKIKDTLIIGVKKTEEEPLLICSDEKKQKAM